MTNENHLAQEKSPYLLQHKNNPVDWYPWGTSAFNKAQQENKPIFLSIGYSTCYWCHVMEKDSFETEEVADVLNKHFVSIKVDREERPEVDKIYMDAVLSLIGHGGWPLSVFLTPDLKPFYGGTFFWRTQFTNLLKSISNTWENDPEKATTSAEKLTEFLNKEIPTSNSKRATEIINAFIEQALPSYDPINGGFGPAPKFPQCERLSLLLRIAAKENNDILLETVENTLNKMSRGGIYDLLGGGFHRYAVDKEWLVPHFEKMLYDNALLAVTYLEAFQFTKNENYKTVATETLDYILRDMTSPTGAFYSAEDAGEVGKEGEFYVWSYHELQNALSKEELILLENSFGVSVSGNLEGNNILHLPSGTSWNERISAKQIIDKLLKIRCTRERPHLDDKILTDWNGLTIAALSKAAAIADNPQYLAAAEKAAGFITNNLFIDDKLLHRYRDNEAKFAATLNDYAYLIYGLLELFQVSGNETWISFAIKLQQQQDELLWDNDLGGYFFADPKDETLIITRKEFIDNATPSANGISAKNLIALYHLTYEKKYLDRANQIFQAAATYLNRHPFALPSLVTAVDQARSPFKQVVIIGERLDKNVCEFLRELRSAYRPDLVIAIGTETEIDDSTRLAVFRGKKQIGEQTTFYICENNSCKEPTNCPKEALRHL